MSKALLTLSRTGRHWLCAIDAHKLAIQRFKGCDSAVNPSSLVLKARVKRTHDNPSVGWREVMQLNKVSPIECDQSAPLIDGKGKHFGIGDFLLRSARLKRCQHIMAKPTQCFNRW